MPRRATETSAQTLPCLPERSRNETDRTDRRTHRHAAPLALRCLCAETTGYPAVIHARAAELAGFAASSACMHQWSRMWRGDASLVPCMLGVSHKAQVLRRERQVLDAMRKYLQTCLVLTRLQMHAGLPNHRSWHAYAQVVRTGGSSKNTPWLQAATRAALIGHTSHQRICQAKAPSHASISQSRMSLRLHVMSLCLDHRAQATWSALRCCLQRAASMSVSAWRLLPGRLCPACSLSACPTCAPCERR